MAIKTRAEINDMLKERFGDSDTDLQMLGDFMETLDDMESQRSAENKTWEERYNNLDKEWRTKYKERFFDTPQKVEETKQEKEDIREDIRIDDLFN